MKRVEGNAAQNHSGVMPQLDVGQDVHLVDAHHNKGASVSIHLNSLTTPRNAIGRHGSYLTLVPAAAPTPGRAAGSRETSALRTYLRDASTLRCADSWPPLTNLSRGKQPATQSARRRDDEPLSDRCPEKIADSSIPGQSAKHALRSDRCVLTTSNGASTCAVKFLMDIDFPL